MALILIIDDSSTTRKAILQIVKADGYEALTAVNGREGLEIIAATPPDCIILDLIMPDVDGFEVLKALREQRSKIPVIVLTADIQKIVRQECLELGAADFINKPMIKKELSDKIRKSLGFEEEVSNETDIRTN